MRRSWLSSFGGDKGAEAVIQLALTTGRLVLQCRGVRFVCATTATTTTRSRGAVVVRVL